MMLISKLKAWLIAVGLFALTIITLGGYARHQKRRAEKAEQKTKQATEQNRIKDQVLKDVKQKQKAINDAYRLDSDELDKRLRDDYRD